ncbi:hypothetical protein RFI_21286 [Reticulomyxa filosa]|uniref:CAP-Gly domain-containing protein n=1 Tax=Reticulomyxa filosa TaxID=46433 RepID=X6MQE7_RETFI|nr:hypothetical protein RFI_21286 [Reticulomyxa filosa]|eukprot:ETO16074.1 hypothetical protein RFI_21286 [Reticulomyxa filosa]
MYMYMYMYMKGTIRYISPNGINDNESIGIELDKPLAQGHDGKGKFSTRHGYGLFVTTKDIHKVFPQLSELNLYAAVQSNREFVAVNKLDRVRMQGGRTGIVRYMGPLVELSEINKDYLGVELDEWDANATAGTFKGRKYFDVNSNRGAFIHRSQVIENLGNTEAIGKDIAPPKPYNGDLSQGKFVKTKYYGIGKVLFIGFGSLSDGEIIGLELQHWWPNGGDGTVDGKEYFKCQHGYSRIGGTQHRRKANRQPCGGGGGGGLQQLPVVKDRVRIFDGQTGVIQFIGTTEFAEGTWIGLVLDDFSANATDGTVKSTSYFRTHPHRGFFAPPKHLIENLGSIINEPFNMVPQANSAKHDIHLNVGDRILLAEGGVGVVKYIGTETSNDSSEPLIGVELDTWDPNANDGTFHGQTLFQTKMGRGLFTRRQSVLQVLSSKSDAESLFKKEEEEAGGGGAEGSEKTPQEGDHVLLHSGEEGIVQQTGKEILIVTLIGSSTNEEKKPKPIKLADVKQNLGKHQTPLQQELLKH